MSTEPKGHPMQGGQSLGRNPNHPALFVIPGAEPYLWVGNAAPNDMMCFATITGRPKLLRIAHEILKLAGLKAARANGEDAMSPEAQRWLIWSNEHRAWWAANQCGYTPSRKTAGRYSFAEALEITTNANYAPECKDRPNETMLPEDSP